MGFNFPNAPTVGQTYNAGVGLPTYRWDGQKWSQQSLQQKAVIYADGSVAMTAALTLAPPPVASTDAANKGYVDTSIASSVAGSAVRYDIGQSLTTAQQSQGRANIDAAQLDLLASANIVINGGFEVSQDNGATLITLANNTAKYIVDGWIAGYNHAANTAVITERQQNFGSFPLPGAGCINLLQGIASTGLTAPAAGDYFYCYTPIEGIRTEFLQWGTPAAMPITLGFWVHATIAGTMHVALRGGSPTRSYVVPVTINNPATWEFKTITVPGDPSGAGWVYGNTTGLFLSFCWCAGATYQAPAPSAWATGNYFATAAQTNFVATAGNQVNITGVVMLPGTHTLPTLTGQLTRRYADELALSQRYFYKVGSNVWLSSGMIRAANTASYQLLSIPVPLRAAPASLSAPGCQIFSADTSVTPSTFSSIAYSPNDTKATFQANHPALGAAGGISMINTMAGTASLDARL